jgi:hypothetical protein
MIPMTVSKSIGDGGGMKKLKGVSQIQGTESDGNYKLDVPGIKNSSQELLHFPSRIMKPNNGNPIHNVAFRMSRLRKSHHITEYRRTGA